MIVFYVLCVVISAMAIPRNISKYIMIDQFGYRPADPKIAVIVDPQFGFNADDEFIPGAVYQVRQSHDDIVVFSDSIKVWNYGNTDYTSGDRGWWFDFSSVKEPGDYCLFDIKNNVYSYKFRIAQNVYADVLKAAMRTFYYQRLNDAKELPWAEEPWTDSAAFMGPCQDAEARYVEDKENPATEKDLSGGWMDAGDYNKYVTFAESPVHDLLTAYQINPEAFHDDYNIPESGNGIPDVLDEVKYELEWIKKMQQSDGGVLIKMGKVDWNPVELASKDDRPRYYGPKCSSSSIATAGMFAHAAIVFSKFEELKREARELEKRAIQAWRWYQNNPKCDTCDTQEIRAGDADRSLDQQIESEVTAAIYLLALTGDPIYHPTIKKNYILTAPFYDTDFGMYFHFRYDALLFYTELPEAEENIKNIILSKSFREAKYSSNYQFKPRYDLYQAYVPYSLYTWGSLNPRAAMGSSAYNLIRYGIYPELKVSFMKRALGILHYYHGVNPFGMVYLTNMKAYGAENSVMEIYHEWFNHNDELRRNPIPGYLPGGPNLFYSGTESPPKGEPAQKSFKQWSRDYPEASYQITEPAIYYQASYIKLLSKFVNEKKLTQKCKL